MNYRLIQHYVNKFPPQYREDLFQEGVLAVLNGRDIYCHMVDYLRWWTHYRRRCCGNQFAHDVCDHLRSEDDTIEWIYLKEMFPKINNAISKLKPRWQKLVRWRYWDGLTMKEIGRRTGTTESNISDLNRKILNRLHQYLSV